MAIIACPNCNQKTSTLSEKCAHCGAPLPVQPGQVILGKSESTSGRPRVYLAVQSMLAILLTMAGLVWYYRASGGLQFPPPGKGSIYAIAAGAVWYIALRLWMLFRRIDRDKAN